MQDSNQDPNQGPNKGPNQGPKIVDIAIVGGGLIGATMALAAVREGFTAVVIERQSFSQLIDQCFDGRAYAVARSSRKLLEHIGVWRAIAESAQPIADILVSDSSVGEKASGFFLRLNHSELGPEGFGHMVEDHTLRKALLRALQQADGGSMRDLSEVADLEVNAPGGAVLKMTSGENIYAKLVIGADGKNSKIAQRIQANKINYDYAQIGLVSCVRHEKHHHGVAHELFLPSGPFAILPLKGGHRSSLVWTERADLASAYAHMDDDTYLGEVARRFGTFLGRIELDGGRWTYPLSVMIRESLYAQRLALIGDAARAIHPIAGQGMNYGFRDIGVFVHELSRAADCGEDIGGTTTLARYQRRRQPDNVAVAASTHALNMLFSNDIGPLRAIRRIGVSAFGKIAPLRRAAMAAAAGEQNLLPAFMR